MSEGRKGIETGSIKEDRGRDSGQNGAYYGQGADTVSQGGCAPEKKRVDGGRIGLRDP